jgi:short-subunit dehydrogenase
MRAIQTAVVTGAGSGMGRIWARRMAKLGARVVAIDINEEGLRETARDLQNIETKKCDVGHLESLKKISADVLAKFGTIDRVVHGAAIMPTAYLMKENPERIKHVMRVNYEGTVNVSHAFLPAMLERNYGEFVIFGSVAADALTPQMGAYCASKAAVNAFVEILQHENHKSDVLIHLACPPATDTPLIDQARNTSNPKYFERGFEQNIIAKPEDVIDEIERALARGKKISRPHYMAKSLHFARRFAPGMLWKVIMRSDEA